MKFAENRKVWIKRVKDYRNSGLTVKVWCEKYDLKPSALRYWIHKLNKENKGSIPDAPLEITTSNQFVSVLPRSIPTSSESSLRLTINSFSLEIPIGFNKHQLFHVLQILKQC